LIIFTIGNFAKFAFSAWKLKFEKRALLFFILGALFSIGGFNLFTYYAEDLGVKVSCARSAPNCEADSLDESSN